VVMKFTPMYCQKVHDLLQKNSLTLQLWLCMNVETVGMYVVVVDFIAGCQISETQLSCNEVDARRETLQTLHNNDLVYGNLRSPNVILPPDGKPTMLVDFDWSGRAREATYLPDINMPPSIGWHPDVCRGR
ncbi:hypothetical protein BDZ97DRAFT_1680391, partial [Flammula alnicola]